MSRKVELQDGCEIRGFLIRLYPLQEQLQRLDELQIPLRICWNWMVQQVEEPLDAAKCQAVREGLVPDPGYRSRKGVPCLPTIASFDGMTPDESKASKRRRAELSNAWNDAVYTAMRDRIVWRPYLRDTAKEFGLRQDYQMLSKVLEWHGWTGVKPSAHMLQALAENFRTRSIGSKRKKRRKSHEPMPIQVKSGVCLEIGGRVPVCAGALVVRPEAFETRRGRPFYDARVSIGGMKILGRFPGRLPDGRVLQGIALTLHADGWWASVKTEEPVRQLPQPTPGKVVGIDVGLKYAIAAFDDGTLVRNTRDSQFVDAIAKLRSEADRSDEDTKRKADNRIARMHQKQAKHMKHVIYNEVLKKCVDAEVIRIEKLNSKIGQLGTRHMSVMRLVHSMLVERYGLAKEGGRVEEVDPRYTSQVCSECGSHDKETWGHDDGPIKTCKRCGYRAHRDVNAARNIANGGVVAKVQGPLASRENVAEPVAAE